MPEINIKQSAIHGMAWTLLSKLFCEVSGFIIGIVLARLLSPSDYGIVGMLSIFFAIAYTFADSGLSSALIQKKDCSDDDYSTIFFFNLFVSVLLYLVLFFSAPLIAGFYNTPILKSVTRVSALSLIISGLTSVQQTKLKKELRFKEQSLITVYSMVVTGVIGIILAYRGFGVWALVIQGLAGQLFSSFYIWYISHWFPRCSFSRDSFSRLWRFGSRILGSSLINTIYQNLYTLIIGKAFSPSDVGYFNRANHYSKLPVGIINSTLLKINYPLLSKLQDDDFRLLSAYKKLLSVPMYVLYPMLAGLAVISPSLIPVMIGEKWNACIPYLQILCVGSMFVPLTHINLNLLYVKGRSDLVLRLEFIKKPVAFFIIFITIHFGILWMIIGKAIYNFIAFSINCYYTKRILNYGEKQQLRELLPTFIGCGVMALMTYLCMLPFSSHWAKICVGIPTGIIVYILYSILTHNDCYEELKNIIYNLYRRKIKKDDESL